MTYNDIIWRPPQLSPVRVEDNNHSHNNNHHPQAPSKPFLYVTTHPSSPEEIYRKDNNKPNRYAADSINVNNQEMDWSKDPPMAPRNNLTSTINPNQPTIMLVLPAVTMMSNRASANSPIHRQSAIQKSFSTQHHLSVHRALYHTNARISRDSNSCGVESISCYENLRLSKVQIIIRHLCSNIQNSKSPARTNVRMMKPRKRTLTNKSRQLIYSALPSTFTLKQYLDQYRPLSANNCHWKETSGEECMDHFLKRTLVAPISPDSMFYPKQQRQDTTAQCLMTQRELLDHVISVLMYRQQTSEYSEWNLLTIGYRHLREWSKEGQSVVGGKYTNEFSNPLLCKFLEPMWENLHRVIGDDLMIHILVWCYIFIPFSTSASYHQIAGKHLRFSLASQRAQDKTKNQRSTIHEVIQVLPRSSMFYSTMSSFQSFRSFRDKFMTMMPCNGSKSRDVNQVSVSKQVARELFFHIFPFVGKKSSRASKPGCRATHQPRIAKRFQSILPILFQCLQNYESYPERDQFHQYTRLPPPSRSNSSSLIETLDDIDHIMMKTSSQDAHAAAATGARLEQEFQTNGYYSQDIEGDGESHEMNDDDDGAGYQDEMIPTRSSLSKLNGHRTEIVQLFQYETPVQQVFNYLHSFLVDILPQELFGSRHNVSAFLSGVYHFLTLNKKEDVQLKQIIRKMKLSHMLWLPASKCPHDHQQNQLILEMLIQWIYQDLIIPMLRSKFYVTEMENHASFSDGIHYFKHSIWKRIHLLGLKDLQSSLLRPLKSSVIAQKKRLGYSKLRFVPKATGLRPILNLSYCPSLRSNQARVKSSPSINRMLDPLFQVLKFELSRRPGILGHTVSGMKDIHVRIQKFMLDRKSCARCSASPLYCVAVDIERCFDQIRQRKLLAFVQALITDKELYFVRMYWKIMQSSTDATRVHASLFKSVFLAGEFEPFEQYISQKYLNRSGTSKHIWIDGIKFQSFTGKELLLLLEEHLFYNTISIDQMQYTQKCGIAQGSILSTLLCNLYYAQLEEEQLRPAIFDNLNTADGSCIHSLLQRYTDDFLLITTDRVQAEKFLSLMNEGFPEYGCSINRMKTQLNFSPMGRNGNTAASRWFTWCGLIIDTKTLEIHLNFPKYVTIARREVNCYRTGQHLRKRVLNLLRNKWHFIYFDPNIYGPELIQLNLYRVFVLCGVTLMANVKVMSDRKHVNPSMPFVKKLIADISHKTYVWLQSRHSSSSASSNNVPRTKSKTPKFPLSRNQVKALTITAFASVIAPYSLFHPLLKYLLQQQRILDPDQRILKTVSPKLGLPFDQEMHA